MSLRNKRSGNDSIKKISFILRVILILNTVLVLKTMKMLTNKFYYILHHWRQLNDLNPHSSIWKCLWALWRYFEFWFGLYVRKLGRLYVLGMYVYIIYIYTHAYIYSINIWNDKYLNTLCLFLAITTLVLFKGK